MKDQQKAEDLAAGRVQLLSPLLTSGLDAAKASQLKLSSVRKRDYLNEQSGVTWPNIGPKDLAG